MSRKPFDSKDPNNKSFFDEDSHFDFDIDLDEEYDVAERKPSQQENRRAQNATSRRTPEPTVRKKPETPVRRTSQPETRRVQPNEPVRRERVQPRLQSPYYDEDFYDQGFDELKNKKRYKKDIIKSQDAKQNAKQNREIMRVAYVFVILFVAMIGYLVYFNFTQREAMLSNTNNNRVASMSETVVRGKILSSDGRVLAETVTDADGNESRVYNYGRVFAHVVGTSDINKSGIEAAEEYHMLSADGDVVGNVLEQLDGKKNLGDNVKTTLDADLQNIAYQAMGGYDGAVVAIEPSTGKVLCELSKPDYDPNTLVTDYYDIVEIEGNKQLLNQATQGTFTPGSIFKIFTTLAFMRQNPNYNDYAYECNGSIELNSSLLNCYGGEVHGYVTLMDSFVHSCNTSFANIGQIVTPENLTEVCNTMLFNQSLPTSLVTEKSKFSLSNDAPEWEKGATAIGQGDTAVTPLHMAMIASAIANGGVVMEPYVVDEVVDASGNTVSKNLPKSYGSIMTPSEAAFMQDLMTRVVNQGTAYGASGLGFSVAGKTGTAEVEGTGNNAWFIGYAPVENPQIAICVMVENAPTSSAYVAVPIAAQILYQYYYK